MKSFKKALAVLLTAVISSAIFASCNNNADNKSVQPDDSSAVSAVQSSDESVLSEESSDAFPYEAKYFNGKTVKIFTVSKDRHTYGELQFVPDEELTDNVINEAVTERNRLISDTYGIDIEIKTAKYPTEMLLSLISGDSADFDIVCDSVDRMVSLVSDKLFYSLDDILNLDDPWWDQRSVENLSIDGEKHFFVSGDCMLTDVDNIYLTLYNKSLYAKNTDITTEYGDIYKLVKDKKFTLDAFTEMSKLASHPDENGDWSYNATYGNLSHAYGANIMVNGAGVALAEKTNDGGMRISVADEKALAVFDKVYSLMSNKQITSRAELIIGKSENVKSTYGFAELQEQFTTGRGLFFNTTVSSISILKNLDQALDFQFGILPIPLYDENQTEYYCSVNRYHSSVLGITINNKDNIEATAYLMNLLGYYNRYQTGRSVLQAYYEVTLKSRSADVEEDAEMLDIIFDSRFYDLGSIFTWSTLCDIYGQVIANDTANTIVSKWESIETAATDAMNKTIEDYKKSLL